MTQPLRPLEPRGHKPEIAEVLRPLATGRVVDPWLPFPQTSCRFLFGQDKPLPVGALRRLWNTGSPWAQTCPQCGGTAYAVDFGAALLAIGWIVLVCTDCERELWQPAGHLMDISRLLDKTLARTRFRPTSMFYGGSRPSDGAELRVALGLAKPPARKVTPAAKPKADTGTPGTTPSPKPTPRRKPVLKPPGGRRRPAEDEVSVSISTRAGRKPRSGTDLEEASEIARTERQAGKPAPTSKGPRGQSVTAARSATAKPKRSIPGGESSDWMRRLMAKGLTREEAITAISNFFM